MTLCNLILFLRASTYYSEFFYLVRRKLVKSARPFLRLRAKTLRPLAVPIRARKPITLIALSLLPRSVLFVIIKCLKYYQLEKI